MRFLRSLVPAALVSATFFSAACAANAQSSSGYAEFNYSHIDVGQPNTSTLGFPMTISPSTFNTFGLTFGGTWSMSESEHHNLGIDLRETSDPSTSDGGYLTFVGVRYAFKNPHSRITPFVEGGGGFMVLNANAITHFASPGGVGGGYTTSDTTSFYRGAFGGYGGIDFAFNSTISYRVEYGGGGLSSGGSFSGLNTGLVFNF